MTFDVDEDEHDHEDEYEDEDDEQSKVIPRTTGTQPQRARPFHGGQQIRVIMHAVLRKPQKRIKLKTYPTS